MKKTMVKNKTYIGFKPTDYQIDTIKLIKENKATIVSVLACRQVGKSLLNMNILLDIALNNANKTSMYIAPTFKQTKKVYKELLHAVSGANIVKNSNMADMIINFINGSQIIFGSGLQGDGLRGFTITGILIIDEARDISDELFYEVLTPMTRVHGANILLTSTPRYKSGFFYNCFSKGGIYNGYKAINYTEYDLSRFLTNEYIASAKINLPKNAFDTEVLGKFLDDNSTVFGDFTLCILDKLTSDKITHVGIDWSLSSGGDNNVITLLNENCEMVEQIIINNTTSSDVVNKIAKRLNGLGNHKINVLAELNSIGTVYFDNLKDKLNHNLNLVGFNTTNKSKKEIVERLQLAVENKEIKLINDENLFSEMRTFRVDYNPKTRTVSYGAANGCHDDRVMSLCFALHCFNTIKVKSNYIYSIL